MSYYDGFTPTYTFSLCIERSDRVLVDTTVEVKATAEEIAKAKKTIQRLMKVEICRSACHNQMFSRF